MKVSPAGRLRYDIRLLTHVSTPPADLHHYGGFKAGDRLEYVKHVANHVRCGKVVLLGSARAGGEVFSDCKRDSDRQREVWHGKRVSAASASPPKPPDLADVCALQHILLKEGKLRRVSKRDARCCFDQLKLGGSSLGELPQFCRACCQQALTSARVLYPCSGVQPMGFAWSSYISQSTMLGICAEAGLSRERFISADSTTPSGFDMVFAVATDDVMLMSTSVPGVSTRAAQKLDDAMTAAGMVKHAAKDIDDELNTTCIGLALEDGIRWCVPPQRCYNIVALVCLLLRRGRGSPAQVQHVLGLLQWYDLMCRGKLSVCRHVYRLVNNHNDQRVIAIPDAVADELLLSLDYFGPLTCVDLSFHWTAVQMPLLWFWGLFCMSVA